LNDKLFHGALRLHVGLTAFRAGETEVCRPGWGAP